jgi:hypothetical protein
MNLDLTDEETEALLRELDNLIDSDRYQFSARVRTLKAIRAKIRPEPVREPLPPKQYAPPRATAQRHGEGDAKGLALSVALRASDDEDDGEQRADRRQAPNDLRDLCSLSAKRRS